jgi:hypothetical protein
LADVLFVSLGSTAGLREADAQFAASLERAGVAVALVAARPPREVRTLMLTDYLWARAARVAAHEGLRTAKPRTVLYSSITAALLWPRRGAIRFDALARANRLGHDGWWQRPLERRRLAQSSLLLPWSEASLGKLRTATPTVVIGPAIEPSGPAQAERDIAAITYAADPKKKGLDAILAAWQRARRDGEELVVAGLERLPSGQGVRSVGLLPHSEYRSLLRRARVYLTAPRREDHGIAQLEALADGCMLVTTLASAPYHALARARPLDPRLVTDDLAAAIRAALDDPRGDYGARVALALARFAQRRVDEVIEREVLPALLGSASAAPAAAPTRAYWPRSRR